ncbi:MAG: choice-of-anchor Q domain-containing protein [Bacteroidota bacterium]
MTKKIFFLIAVGIAGITLFGCQEDNFGVYYVDANTGNDNASGTSAESPWKTLSKVSSTTFQPGDQILFKAGSVWNERLVLSGSGTEKNPIIIDKYGDGNKPIFNGGGGSESLPTVLLENEEYWEINNLEITNSNGSIATYQSDLWGIRVNVTEAGEFNHIYIRNCYIHAVGSDVPEAKSGGKLAGGIYVTVESPPESPAWYNDLKIQNNEIGGESGGDLVGGLGIATNSTHGELDKDKDRKPFLNVVISNNIVGPTGRNNVIIRVSDGAVVEHNLLRDAGRFSKGHSIFNFNTTNLTVQYNEAFGNTGPAGEADRGAFDADYNARNTYYQYNYSHDNNWGFAFMKKGINENPVFRYNISENDKLAVYFYGFEEQKGPQRAQVYNNTHYVSSGHKIEVFKDRTAANTDFYNNIFYFQDSASWGSKTPVNCTFENNAYFNIGVKGSNAVVSDPKLVKPGHGDQRIDWSDYPDVLTGYQLQPMSPCIDAGKKVADNGEQDFWGNPLYNGSPDIGAYEFTLNN